MVDIDDAERQSLVERFRVAMHQTVESLVDADTSTDVLRNVVAVAEETAAQFQRATSPGTLWGYLARNETEAIGMLMLGVSARPAPPLQTVLEGDTLVGSAVLGREHAGPRGAAHGGVIATLFDEFLAQLHPSAADGRVRTSWLRIEYLAPVPLAAPLRLSARVSSVDGRKVTAEGQIASGDLVCALASGLFVSTRAETPPA